MPCGANDIRSSKVTADQDLHALEKFTVTSESVAHFRLVSLISYFHCFTFIRVELVRNVSSVTCKSCTSSITLGVN